MDCCTPIHPIVNVADVTRIIVIKRSLLDLNSNLHSYLLYVIHSMLSAMQLTDYVLQMRFDHRPKFRKMLDLFRQHTRYLKRRKEGLIASAVIYD